MSPEFPDVLYAFIGVRVTLSKKEVEGRLRSAGDFEDDIPRVFELLLWFGFLGIIDREGEERFAYQYQYGVLRMMKEAPGAEPTFVIHPAFRLALGCET